MNDPARLLDSSEVSSLGRRLLEAHPPTAPMPDGVQADLDLRVAEVATSPVTLVGTSTKMLLVAAGVAATIAAGIILWPKPPSLSSAPSPAVPTQAGVDMGVPIERFLPTPTPTPADEPAPTLDQPEPPKARALKRTAPVKPSASSLAEEQRMLERARKKLRSDPQAAITLADAHFEKYEKGQLADLREYIVIQGLDALGSTSALMGRAKKFLVKYPTSTFASRVRTIARKHADGEDSTPSTF